MYALAFDLGTTTLAASLIDLADGTRLAMAGSINPQRRFGSDVVSRLEAAVASETVLQEMSGLVRKELWRLARELLQAGSRDLRQVSRVAVAGNPAMQHILLGLPVDSLARPPFRPVCTGGTRLSTAALQWDADIPLYILPMPGGFVGGDTVAFLYGQQGYGQTNQPLKQGLFSTTSAAPPTVYLDLGTNGEMALVADTTIWATSAAAGPAFEGGNLSCGMPALPGAISSVRIEGERLSLSVIGSGTPTGICGSAAIEIIHELLRAGIIDSSGRLLDSLETDAGIGNRIISQQGENVFVLYRDARTLLTISQADIRQVQLAKGAIRAGLEVLAGHANLPLETIESVVLTGSFGAVLRPEWLKTIGIFDESMLHITRFAPEGALTGVETALLAHDDFASLERLAGRFRVVPLSGTPLFEQAFMRTIDFPAS